jgi:hypothetical protein
LPTWANGQVSHFQGFGKELEKGRRDSGLLFVRVERRP